MTLRKKPGKERLPNTRKNDQKALEKETRKAAKAEAKQKKRTVNLRKTSKLVS